MEQNLFQKESQLFRGPIMSSKHPTDIDIQKADSLRQQSQSQPYSLQPRDILVFPSIGVVPQSQFHQQLIEEEKLFPYRSH